MGRLSTELVVYEQLLARRCGRRRCSSRWPRLLSDHAHAPCDARLCRACRKAPSRGELKLKRTRGHQLLARACPHSRVQIQYVCFSLELWNAETTAQWGYASARRRICALFKVRADERGSPRVTHAIFSLGRLRHACKTPRWRVTLASQNSQ